MASYQAQQTHAMRVKMAMDAIHMKAQQREQMRAGSTPLLFPVTLPTPIEDPVTLDVDEVTANEVVVVPTKKNAWHRFQDRVRELTQQPSPTVMRMCSAMKSTKNMEDWEDKEIVKFAFDWIKSNSVAVGGAGAAGGPIIAGGAHITEEGVVKKKPAKKASATTEEDEKPAKKKAAEKKPAKKAPVTTEEDEEDEEDEKPAKKKAVEKKPAKKAPVTTEEDEKPAKKKAVEKKPAKKASATTEEGEKPAKKKAAEKKPAKKVSVEEPVLSIEVPTTAPVIETVAKEGKKKIPKHIKTLVWNKYIGASVASAKCMCCRQADIYLRSFDCGHVIAEAKGGDGTINNLRPICRDCNQSMGTRSMNEFTAEFFGWTV